MQFLTFTVLVLVASCQGDDKGKRGVAEYSPQQVYAQAPQATSGLAYTKQLQAASLATAQKSIESVPQTQYYTQQGPVKYTATPIQYSAAPVQQQQQYQYEQQAVAFAQPTATKYAAAVSKVPHYSLANDVSSFAYSSPIVQYNNLGLLTQIVGKAAAGATLQSSSPSSQSSSKLSYQSIPSTKYVTSAAPAAPAPATYQASPQKVAYSTSPVTFSQQPKYATAAAPAPQYITVQQQPQQHQQQQQYISAAQLAAAQNAAPQYYRISQASAAPQTYSLSQQDNAQYDDSASQAYAQAQAQAASQPQYFQTQYYSAPQQQQSKYSSAGESYSQQ